MNKFAECVDASCFNSHTGTIKQYRRQAMNSVTFLRWFLLHRIFLRLAFPRLSLVHRKIHLVGISTTTRAHAKQYMSSCCTQTIADYDKNLVHHFNVHGRYGEHELDVKI